MDKIFIRVDSGTADNDVTWIRMDNSGKVTSGPSRASLDELAEVSRSSRVIVLVPAEDVLLTRANVPARSRRQLTQALPFALEDQLAQDVDRLHFAMGSLDKARPPAVAVIAKDRMLAWRNRLEKAGIRAAMMVPETLSVPITSNQWTLLIDEGMAVVRTGVWDGFAVDAANTPVVLGAALQHQSDNPPENLRLIQCGPDDTGEPAVEVSSLGLKTEVLPPEQDSLTCLARGFREQETINLLQGEFSHRSSVSSQWRPWVPTLIIALLWFGLEVGVRLFENHRLSVDIARLEARVENIYRETFPDAKKIVNPRVQMLQQLEALGTTQGQGKDFLDMLAASGNLLQIGGGIRLTGMRYRNGSLHLDIEAGELAIVDGVKERISADTEYAVEILSATAGDNRVRARLEIKGAGQ